MDEKMKFSEHVDFMVGKVFALLGFIRRLSFEVRDPYTLKSLYTFCVWSPLYDILVVMVERVQRRFIRYALRGLSYGIYMIYHRMSIDVLFCALTLL
jgi:hypothetical protein